MDVATHALVPYAFALLALGLWRRDDPTRAAYAAVFGAAGFAPDLDGLLRPLVRRDAALWFLQHRGLSHSLAGAPVFALLLVALLALAARAWPRVFGLFAWRWTFVPVLVLGSWTHLALDSVTFAGVPALFPLSDARQSLELYHWLIDWMLPVSALVLALHAWGKLSYRGTLACAAVIVLVLAGIGVQRALERPAAAEGQLVFPRPSAAEWTIAQRLPNGTWEAFLWTREGGPRDAQVFPDDAPPDALGAIAQAEASDAYKGFHLGHYGPLVTRAHLIAGGWHVDFYDVAQRYDATRPAGWTPADPYTEWGLESFDITSAGGVVETHRGW
ncbi:MAG: inner membrane protein [Thermoplasmata archaeon]|nr:inner membrane protein [Thermoplasmata archaeon]